MSHANMPKLFMLGANARWIGVRLGHNYTAWSAQTFRGSPAASMIGWSSNKPHKMLAALAKDRQQVARVAVNLHKLSKQLEGNGVTHFRLPDSETDGHAYATITKPYKLVSKQVSSWFLDPKNNNPFRVMLGCFPPFGQEQPDKPAPEFFRESSGDLVILNEVEVERWYKACLTHTKERFDSNHEIGGQVALGRSGLITFSDYQVIDSEDLLIRYALASTNAYHVFDGRVIWIQVIDRKTSEVMFFGLGGGEHPFTLVDGANPALGGVVFPAMVRTLVEILNRLGVEQITNGTVIGVGEHASSLSAELREARRIMAWLDQLGRVGAGLRSVLGPEVIGAPEPEEHKEHD